MRDLRNLALFLPVLAACLALAACDMPTEPEGIHEAGLDNIAEKLQASGDDEGAADLYERTLQRKPDDVQALVGIGQIFEKHNHPVEAEAYYATALKTDPTNVGVRYAEGRVLIRANRAEDAAKIFRSLLEDNDKDVKALNGLGIALDYLNQHAEAEEKYRAAMELAPNDPLIVNNLAHSYVLSGNYSEAIKLLEPYAALKEATPALRQNLAEAYGLSGMYADAERLLRMDLPPADVKAKLASYKAQRAKTAPAILAADIGSYPTAEVAAAGASRLTDTYGKNGISIEVTPEVTAVGGTPNFVLRATGFTDAAAIKAFCKKVAADGTTCKQVASP